MEGQEPHDMGSDFMPAGINENFSDQQAAITQCTTPG